MKVSMLNGKFKIMVVVLLMLIGSCYSFADSPGEELKKKITNFNFGDKPSSEKKEEDKGTEEVEDVVEGKDEEVGNDEAVGEGAKESKKSKKDKGHNESRSKKEDEGAKIDKEDKQDKAGTEEKIDKEEKEIDYDKSQIKKLDEKLDKTAKEIDEKQEGVEKAKEEAEAVIAERDTLQQEVDLKEKEAKSLREESELLKTEAKETKDRTKTAKAKELVAEADKLEKEAAESKKKLAAAKVKAKAVEDNIATNETQIENLKKAITGMKKQRAAKRSIWEKIFTSVGIIIAGFIVFLLMRLVLKKFENTVSKKQDLNKRELMLRVQTISKLFNWLGGIIIIVAMLYMVLENHGINVAPILAGLGIMGIAFGFGGQYLIRDLINGLFILVEDQFRINDVVKIGDHGGLVENINLRITTLRDMEGRVIIIPNGEISTVINFTKEYSQAVFDIGVAYKEDVDKVMDVIKEIGREMRDDKHYGRIILADLEMFGVDDLADSQVTIKFRVKTRPIKQWEVKREFTRRIKNRFDELGIEIPFPHTTVYWGAGSDNDWMKKFAEVMEKK